MFLPHSVVVFFSIWNGAVLSVVIVAFCSCSVFSCIFQRFCGVVATVDGLLMYDILFL
jgi:hypothetical protein